MDIPMLTESEWDEVHPLLIARIKAIQTYRSEHNASLKEAIKNIKDEACKKYEEITGFHETNAEAIWHHRLSEHGPECTNCGFLLRSKNASYCANCGTSVS
jgi:predicted Zn-ribbon and HTH transcriptional regulator